MQKKGDVKGANALKSKENLFAVDTTEFAESSAITVEPQPDHGIIAVSHLLNSSYEKILDGAYNQSVDDLAMGLNIIRSSCSDSLWKTIIKPLALGHPIKGLLHQCPYTIRAFDKPRGYAGDAVMLDFIYEGVPPIDTTEIGRRIFSCTTRNTNGLSVIHRREHLAKIIDKVAVNIDRPDILSISCGHMREIELSSAYQNGELGSVTALDSDPHNLAIIKSFHGQKIEVASRSIRALLNNQDLKTYDFIYTAGLYDYIPTSLANRLTRSLFNILKPGGKLLYANFTPNNLGRGYMETYMDWKLILRTQSEAELLTRGIAASEFISRSYTDAYGNIVYVELDRIVPTEIRNTTKRARR
ncbi:class I SAM-dependent methyltransferase [Deinococcus hopiensis]|nr:class I SAM-dependent methyltransferase [Deinococcus hopiensis]